MKNARQAEILRLIGNYHIETQEELADLLNKEGYQVTQATVSRDIRELQLIKVADGPGRSRYSVIQKDMIPLNKKYSRVLKDAFVSAEEAGNILVLKVVPGMAMAAAAALDSLGMEEIVGCIAGDDTIFCAIRTQQDVKAVVQKLRELIEK